MNQPLPLVSIGMPVYNGAPFLREALDALCAQEYPNFEVVISDNASEDETDAICRAYAARDLRIRYYRNEKNYGAAWNFNRVFELSRGEFFMWAACDDLWRPSFIRKCAALLRAHPEASLCHVQSQEMSPEGRPFGEPYHGLVNTDPDPRARWHRVLSDLHWHIAVYGMMRASCMRRTALMRNVWGSDQLFVAEMALYGAIVQVPECLWWHRRPEHISAHDAYRVVMQKLDPAHARPKRQWTQLGIHAQYAQIAMGCTLSIVTRLWLVWAVIINYFSSAAWANDLQEIGMAMTPLQQETCIPEEAVQVAKDRP